jgi:hypothetical protein
MHCTVVAGRSPYWAQYASSTRVALPSAVREMQTTSWVWVPWALQVALHSETETTFHE